MFNRPDLDIITIESFRTLAHTIIENETIENLTIFGIGDHNPVEELIWKTILIENTSITWFSFGEIDFDFSQRIGIRNKHLREISLKLPKMLVPRGINSGLLSDLREFS